MEMPLVNWKWQSPLLAILGANYNGKGNMYGDF